MKRLPHPLVLGAILLAVAVVGFTFGAGCAARQAREAVDELSTVRAQLQEPPKGPAVRRATALELLEASRGTNEPPAWFNAQERAAVLKLRAP